ncbi:MAG: heparinase II/III family protein [Pseudomonadota bacterium]
MAYQTVGLGQRLFQRATNAAGFSAARKADRELVRLSRDLFIDAVTATPGSLRIDTAPETVLPPGKVIDAFAWLRELAAVRTLAAGREARIRLRAWLRSRASGSTSADHVDVIRERVLAVVCASDLLMADYDDSALTDAELDALFECVSGDVAALARGWRGSSTAIGRVSALTTLTLVVLVADSQDVQTRDALAELRDVSCGLLVAELSAQFFDDGGHVSRNPAVTMHALVELIPLLRSFTYLDRNAPDELTRWRPVMQQFLRTLRLCDRGLAAFHGGDAVRAQRLATILKLDPSLIEPVELPDSRFRRIEAGPVQLICDAGQASGEAESWSQHASFGAFVLGDGGCPLFVNCGSGAPTRGGAGRQAWRETACHNTLSLPDAPSAAFADGALSGPSNAKDAVAETPEAVTVSLSHDGYAADFGLRHERSLTVDRTGNRMAGVDRLTSAGALIRLKRDQPFAIHFHLADDVSVRLAPAANCVLLDTKSGGKWQFAVTGAQLYVENSPRFGRRAIPGASPKQLVLRAATAGETQVDWTLTRRFD